MEKSETKSGESEQQNNLNQKRKVVFILFVVLLLVAGIAGTYFLQQNKIDKLNAKIERQKSFINTPNQACIGLNKTEESPRLGLIKLSASQMLQENDPDGKIATFTCYIGQNTKSAVKGMEVARVDSDGREMGAEVIYFGTNDQANSYHQSKINPLRYWSVPNEELTSGVPEFKYFTSYVGNPVYFDAYAVKGNAIVRLTLPCGNPKTEKNEVDKCLGTSVDNGAAISSLREFVKSIGQLDL